MYGQVEYQSRSIGQETDDILKWFTSDGQEHTYIINQIHNGPAYIYIRINENQTGIWVESDEKVVASLDLTTKEFRSEFDRQFNWAEHKKGIIIAEGKTVSFIDVILPW